MLLQALAACQTRYQIKSYQADDWVKGEEGSEVALKPFQTPSLVIQTFINPKEITARHTITTPILMVIYIKSQVVCMKQKAPMVAVE